VSDVTANAIDAEVRRLIDSNYAHAKQILEAASDTLHKMAAALIKFETIDDQQLKDIMEGREPRPPADWEDTPSATAGTPPRERDATDGTIGKPASQH
jgi:cell division protease FtsH